CGLGRAGGQPEPAGIVGLLAGLLLGGGGVRTRRRPWTAALRGQLASWQVAGLAEVNRPGVAHSGWSMNGLRLPWKL
ncbi:PEP-CTERM sorting domain-containing protein, partial [Stenotrophomonas maltophilia]|nr:PEP-CTERM sorting domain-containing protein [Stenotrophomonas maltophilia]